MAVVKPGRLSFKKRWPPIAGRRNSVGVEAGLARATQGSPGCAETTGKGKLTPKREDDKMNENGPG